MNISALLRKRKEKKMSNKKVVSAPVNQEPKKKKNVLLIVAGAVVAIALTMGLVLGIINFISSRRAVMEYDGTRMDEKVAAYLVSTYKTEYLASLKAKGIAYAEDSEEFWNEENPDGSGTFGKGFERAAEARLKQILIGVYLYDSVAEMGKNTKTAIENTANQVASYRYNMESGFEALFEADAEKFGYDYKSFVKAATMLYKSNVACSMLYGENGAGVAQDTDACTEYLNAAYSHVSLVFVRTETTYKLDDEGNRVTVQSGYELEELSEEEKAERQNVINELIGMINGYKVSDSEALAAKITALANNYRSEQASKRIEKGYYFAEGSEYKESFISEARFEPIVKKALAMQLDETGRAFGYCELNLDGKKTDDEKQKAERVVCFIYKSEPKANAYADVDLSDFFTDFYKGAAQLAYAKDVIKRSADVKVKDKFYEMQVALIPENKLHVIREFLTA